MRIAILSCFYPYRGGIAQFNACLYNELSKGNEVKAFNFKRQYPNILFPGKTQYVSKDDEAVPVESVSLLDTANPFTYIKTLKAIRAWGPDLLIVRYWMSWFAPSLGYITRDMKKHCKVISILDNVIPHEPRFFDTPLTKYFLKGSHGSITLCEAVGKDLEKLAPNMHHRAIQHPLYSHFGAKKDRYETEERLGLEHNKKNLLFFGLIRHYKGLDILLEAFAKLPEDYQLIIAGEPYEDMKPYEEIITSNGIADRVHIFPHYIKDSEVSDYYSVADLLVMPYRSATQSGVSSVSYHFEVPLIVTNVGGLKETIGDRGTGLVADKPEPHDIEVEIKKYFSDKEIAAECIKNIKKEKERLSWTNFCRQLIEFSKEL